MLVIQRPLSLILLDESDLYLFSFFKSVSSSSPKLAECLQKKKEVIEQMEVKLDTGIDRSVCL